MKEKIQKDIRRKGDNMTEEKAMLETGWNFDNSYARLPNAFFTSFTPDAVRSPKLIILNDSVGNVFRIECRGTAKQRWCSGYLLATEFQKALCLLLKLMRGINLGILTC